MEKINISYLIRRSSFQTILVMVREQATNKQKLKEQRIRENKSKNRKKSFPQGDVNLILTTWVILMEENRF